MSYKVLYRKYRPANFNELVGQKQIKESLINAIKRNQLAHAYIFTGPRGTGKTSTAKIFAKALTCLSPIEGDSCGKCDNCLQFNENPDIIEIDAASNNGVNEIREIRNNVKLVPTMSKYKIYIIDEVHMLSISAWNAFLKTLEEPPSHVIFIFATTDIQKVPVTVLSRCQRYDFHRISDEEIEKHINFVAKKESIEITDDAVKSLVKLSDGCLRDCLSHLDQLSKISLTITENMISEVFGIISKSYITDLIEAIEKNDIKKCLNCFEFIKEQGIDASNLTANMIDYLITEASNIKLGNKNNLTNFGFCQKLINDLFDVQSKIKFIDNPYNLLLITFLSYFNDDLTANKKNIDEKSNQDISQKDKNISREIKLTEFNTELKKVRTNNVFCKANKQAKKNFLQQWSEFVSLLTEENNFAIMGYINSMVIEVVSDEYVLFSTDVVSDSVIFNNNLESIENEFNKLLKRKYKFICLSSEEWIKEKDNFIKNKNKKRDYIDESTLNQSKEDNSLEDTAKDIFGDIIEIS